MIAGWLMGQDGLVSGEICEKHMCGPYWYLYSLVTPLCMEPIISDLSQRGS